MMGIVGFLLGLFIGWAAITYIDYDHARRKKP